MGSADDGGRRESPDELFGRRTKSRSRFIEWVLVDGDRLVLTFFSAALVFAFLLFLRDLTVIGFTNSSAITRMASGMIAGSFSLVTLVVSVNQLILSQEFSPAGEFRDRFSGVLEFRRDIESVSHVPATPAEPTRMLELLLTAIRDRANDLADAIADHENDEYRALVGRYTDSLTENTDQVDATLDETNVSAYDALSAAVEYNQGLQLYAARHLRNDAPTLSEQSTTAFDELIEALRLFSTAQEHFKTVYLQRELTRFSQLTIYCGVPSVFAAILIALLHGDARGLTLSVVYLPYVTSLLVTVVVLPLLLLATYILRTATITRRTAEIGPMVPQKAPGEGPFSVTYGAEKDDESR